MYSQESSEKEQTHHIETKPSQKIFISKNNYDIFDTLNGPIMDTISDGTVELNMENKVNDALACIYQTYKQLRQERENIYQLKKKFTLSNRVLEDEIKSLRTALAATELQLDELHEKEHNN